MKYTINEQSFETSAAIIKSDNMHHVLYRNDIAYSGNLNDAFEFVQTLPAQKIERLKTEIEQVWSFDWSELEEILA